jgi:hypothetical protein
MNPDAWKWLTSFTGFGGQRMEAFGFPQLLAVLGVSLACSVFIAFLFVRIYGARATGSGVHRSFILLGPSITAVFICIQFSLPLSLGLLGALSIVRFRTPIKEPVEIGFIMVVVATSLACATFNMVFLGGILLIVILALAVLKCEGGLLKGIRNEGMLVVTLPRDDYRQNRDELHALLAKELPGGSVDSIAETDDESVISYAFANPGSAPLPDLGGLAALSGRLRYNLFFRRSPCL